MPNTTYIWLARKECGEPGFKECHIAKSLYAIVVPALLVFGTVGNILSFAILSRSRMKKYSITVYLQCLAVSDLTMIWWSTVRHMLLTQRDIDILDVSTFSCKVYEWVSHSAGGLSLWIPALMTLERTLFTRHPARARNMKTRRNALILIMVTFGILSLLNSHVLFGFSLHDVKSEVPNGNGTTFVSGQSCYYTSPSYQKFYLLPWKYILILVLNIIPLILIVSGNAVILVTLMLQRRKIQPTTPFPMQPRNEKINIATKMMFIMSAEFVCTTAPFCIFLLMMSQLDSGVDDKRFAQLQLGNAVVNIVLESNYAFNFLLYCTSGTNFRQEGSKMMIEIKTEFFKMLRYTNHNRHNVRTANTTHTGLESNIVGNQSNIMMT